MKFTNIPEFDILVVFFFANFYNERSDSVLWQMPLYQQKTTKSILNKATF